MPPTINRTNPTVDPTQSASDGDRAAELERQATQAQPGVMAELADFLLHNKKWWLTPIVVVLLLLGLLIAATATPLAPFIYTLF